MIRTVPQAKAECERWLEYLQAQEDKSQALQYLAADRRAGRCDAQDARRRLDEIQTTSLRVYDGADLSDAVRVLLKAVNNKEGQADA